VASGSGTGSGITIYGAQDSSTINLGSGTDTVTLGSAAETVNGGSGNEIFNVNATTIGATIAGGSGSNTLNVTNGGTAVMGANITGVETVVLAAATNFTANNLDLTITGHGNDTIRAGSGTDTITGAASSVLIAGSGVDTFKDTSAHLSSDTIENFAAGDTIDITNLKPSAKQPTTATWANDVLTVKQGSKTVASIALDGDFTGTFSASSDGAKGTDITYSPAAHAEVANLVQAMASFGVVDAASGNRLLTSELSGLHGQLAVHG
jgi:Ca2+-binding RTX toxin-like protein